MEEHRHISAAGDDEQCVCGVRMCSALSPDKNYGCTLKEGHSGPHTNTWVPGYETWQSDERNK